MEKSKPIELCPEVKAFAEQMELTLRRHDKDHAPSGDWRKDPLQYLLLRLHEEVAELHVYLASNKYPIGMRATLHGCTDIANFAMMIADRSSKLVKEK